MNRILNAIFLLGLLSSCESTNEVNAPATGNPITNADAFVPPPVAVNDAGAASPEVGVSPDGESPASPGRCRPGQTEACDDFDNDCDGQVDEGCPCTASEKACYSGDPRDLESPLSACRSGVQACRLESFGPCMGEILPEDETCDGLDNDCDGFLDELVECGANVPPEAICPPDQIGPPLANYRFEGQYRDPDGDEMTRAEWRIVQRPPGSTSEAAPSDGMTTEIFSDLQGTYVLEFEVEDDRGGIARCTTTLTTESRDGLRIEMVWNVNAEGDSSDLDMHLLKSPAGSWFDLGGSGDDCFYANCKVCDTYDEEECRAQIAEYNADPNRPPPPQVTWFPPLDNDDPRLDLDDVEGQGPENININRPRDGTYRLGVHYYDDDGFGPSTVSMRIFCAGEISREFGPQVLSNGQQTVFWEVADIQWSNGDCQVIPLGTPDCSRICYEDQARNGGCPANQELGRRCP